MTSALDTSLPVAPLPPVDTLLEVRTGKIRPFGTTGLRSAIAKAPRQGALFVSETGLVGDEQQYVHHGGVEKALHQYCASHYEAWQLEKPDRAHLYIRGGFGENLVSPGLNEHNVCIGDIFRIGDEVRARVTEPRLPCYKLNHRFEWSRAAIRTQQTGRTGWYYSVVQTGHIRVGDTVTLVSRPYPRWSVRQVLRAMYEDQNPVLLQELSGLAGLGHQIRDIVLGRMAGQAEDIQARLDRVSIEWRPFKLVDKAALTPRIQQFVFALNDADLRTKLPDLGPYPYVRLRFGPNGIYTRAYSVVGGSKERFVLGVALDRHSRGGSRFLHEQLDVGMTVSVAGSTAPNLEKEEKEDEEESVRHVFIVGGIGVTAIVLEVQRLQAMHAAFEIHYACASMKDAAYVDVLPPEKTTYYPKDQGKRLCVGALVPEPHGRSKPLPRIFCCGPLSLLEAVEQRVKQLDYPEHCCRLESFGGEGAGGEPFEAEIASSGAVLPVPVDKSLLQILGDAGFDTPSSCLVGNCGMCMVDYRKGSIQHKGTALTKQQKRGSFLSCVSRGKGRILLDV